MKKVLSVLLAIALMLGMSALAPISASALDVNCGCTNLADGEQIFEKGNGTVSDPWIIRTPEQLNHIREHLDKHFKLELDIELGNLLLPGRAGYNEGQGWMPIGDRLNPFTGSLDGDGYGIVELYIKRDVEYVGLFGYLDGGAVIKNLSVGTDGVGIIGGDNVGALAGCINGSTIESCHTSGIVSSDADNARVGGLIGARGYGISIKNVIANCSSSCAVSGSGDSNTYIGGLVGSNSGFVVNCYATGEVKASGKLSSAGGLAAISHGNVINCYATGNVIGDYIVGGLISYVSGTVINCYATGNVVGSIAGYAFPRIGGLVGNAHDATINSCYANGNVTSGGSANIGGLVGLLFKSTLKNSYANGDVTSTETSTEIGGLVGVSDIDSMSANCYAMGDVIAGDSSTVDAGGLVGRNYSQLINCYSFGNVTGSGRSSFLGGLVGRNREGGEITICYTVSVVEAGGTYTYGAGLVGRNENATITQCYWGSEDGIIGGDTGVYDDLGGTTITQWLSYESMRSDKFVEMLNGHNRDAAPNLPPCLWTRNEKDNSGFPYHDYYKVTVEGSAVAGINGTWLHFPGEDVQLVLNPGTREGWEFERWKVIDDVLEIKENNIIFMPNCNVTISAQWREIPDIIEPVFEDVSPDDWFYEYVMYCYENGIMNGTTETTFEPNATLSRAMLATVLYRMAGQPPVTYDDVFSDVPDGLWYSVPIIWASKAGIVNGYGDGLFGPNDAITREQFATMMYRYAKYEEYDLSAAADLSGYTDAGEISDWAIEGMRWCVAKGLISGMTATTLAPRATATRAECATILTRFMINVT